MNRNMLKTARRPLAAALFVALVAPGMAFAETAKEKALEARVADLERQAALMAVAQSDARRLLADDPGLETDRGRAARNLLWLLDQDRAIRLISVG